MEEASFYDFQLKYQQKQSDIEQQRSELEKKMFSLLRSDKNLHSLKTEKLRKYWQSICEREKIAKKRNESLLEDFEAFERKIKQLEMKTTKLRNLKKHYEDKVREMYPKWRQQVDIAFAKKQLEKSKLNFSPNTSNVSPKVANNTVFHADNDSTNYINMTNSTPKNIQKQSSVSISAQSSPIKSDASAKSSFHNDKSDKVRVNYNPQMSQSSDKISRQIPNNISEVKNVPSQLSIDNSMSMELPPPISFAETPKAVVSVVKVPSTPVSSHIETSAKVQAPTASVHQIPTAHSSPENSEVSFSEVSLHDEQNDNLPPKVFPSQQHQINVNINANKIVSPVRTVSKQSASFNSEDEAITNSADVVVNRPNSRQFFSDSASSASEISPRRNNPLTTNSAYQKMLKSHSTTNAVVEVEDDFDNVEDLLSPRSPTRYSPSLDEEHDMSEDASDISEYDERAHENQYLPTMMSSMQVSDKSVNPKAEEVNKEKEIQNDNKVPWDLDSDDDNSLGPNSFLGNTTGSSWKPQHTMEQDDFDFYD